MTTITTETRFDDADGVPFDAVRIDSVQELPAAERTDEGYLKTHAYTARPGIYAYRQDGKVVRELVPRSTLEDASANATLALKPVTLGHPPAMLTPDTVADFSIGTTGESVSVRADGRTQVGLMVTDGSALRQIEQWQEAGEVLGTSPGYNVRIDNTAGVDPEFGAYDRIQIGRTYNHLALTPRPRGGAGVYFRMDGVPEPLEAAPENDDMDLIDALIELGYSRTDAETLSTLETGKALIEKAEKFDAIPERDLEAEKAERVAERKERRQLVDVAAEYKLDESDDFDIDALDNVELKEAILKAADAPETKLDGVDADTATRLRFDAFLAFRKDAAEDDSDDNRMDEEEVEVPATPTTDTHSFDAWA